MSKHTLPELLVRHALDEIGRGEEGGNNRGPDINKYRQGRTSIDGNPWCARFVWFCLLLASWASGRRWCVVRSTGSARVLMNRLLRKGQLVTSPEPGDIALWVRAGGKHINIVESVNLESNTFITVDGNKGRFPSTVGLYEHRLQPLPLTLIKIVRLPL